MGMIVSFVRSVAVAVVAVTGVAGAGVAPAAAAAAAVPAGAQPAPAAALRAGFLEAVSCSSATACTALGGSLGALAWNGTTWASQRVPSPRRTAQA